MYVVLTVMLVDEQHNHPLKSMIVDNYNIMSYSFLQLLITQCHSRLHRLYDKIFRDTLPTNPRENVQQNEVPKVAVYEEVQLYRMLTNQISMKKLTFQDALHMKNNLPTEHF